LVKTDENPISFNVSDDVVKKTSPYLTLFCLSSDLTATKPKFLGQGSIRVNISKVKFLELEFYFPKKQEQQKIANTLSTLDNLIVWYIIVPYKKIFTKSIIVHTRMI
jgi:restriction endonuclease S subunit